MKIEKISRIKTHTIYKRAGDSKRVPSVTTVLGTCLAKPFLIKWANNLGLQGVDSSKYVDRLATIGTLAHHWIESILNGIEPTLDGYSDEEKDYASNSVIKFLEYHSEIKPRIIRTELKLVSEDYGYGGTIDCLCEIAGQGVGILDIKTGKAIYDEHLYQLAAYFQLAQEHGYNPQWVTVVQVGRNAEEGFSVRHCSGPELAKNWDVFEACLNLYQAVKAVKAVKK